MLKLKIFPHIFPHIAIVKIFFINSFLHVTSNVSENMYINECLKAQILTLSVSLVIRTELSIQVT